MCRELFFFNRIFFLLSGNALEELNLDESMTLGSSLDRDFESKANTLTNSLSNSLTSSITGSGGCRLNCYYYFLYLVPVRNAYISKLADLITFN